MASISTVEIDDVRYTRVLTNYKPLFTVIKNIISLFCVRRYLYLIGIVIADVLDQNHPCYCARWLERYEPSSGCLNGTRWVIQDCSTRLDSSCYYNTMWREKCGWEWSNWAKCSKECGEGESVRVRVCESEDCPPENGSVSQRKYCQIQDCPVTEMNLIEEGGDTLNELYEDFSNFDLNNELEFSIELEKDRQAHLHQNKMRVYPIIGAIYCVSLLLFCVCLCKLRKKRQKNMNSDGTATEKAKISEIEDSSSSNSESESIADIIDHPSLIQI